MKQELIDWWENATNFWRIRQFKRRIKRFIAWFPIIWRDEDWGPEYLYEIMRFKISRIRKLTERCDRHIRSKQDVKNMKIAEELLNRQAFSEFYWDNDQKNKEFCTCKPYDLKDCFEEIPGTNGASLWKSPFCEWCCRKTQGTRQSKKEKEDFVFLWDHLRKQSNKWWS